jgi:hypothetical protein
VIKKAAGEEGNTLLSFFLLSFFIVSSILVIDA